MKDYHTTYLSLQGYSHTCGGLIIGFYVELLWVLMSGIKQAHDEGLKFSLLQFIHSFHELAILGGIQADGKGHLVAFFDSLDHDLLMHVHRPSSTLILRNIVLDYIDVIYYITNIRH